MLILLVKIDKKLRNYKIEALNDFIILERNCNILLNQYEIYECMMRKLNVKANSDLYKQNQEKIIFINEYLQLIRKNINILQNIINNPQLKHIDVVSQIFSLKELNIERKYSEDTLDYFRDYGMCLYNLVYQQSNGEECIIY